MSEWSKRNESSTYEILGTLEALSQNVRTEKFLTMYRTFYHDHDQMDKQCYSADHFQELKPSRQCQICFRHRGMGHSSVRNDHLWVVSVSIESRDNPTRAKKMKSRHESCVRGWKRLSRKSRPLCVFLSNATVAATYWNESIPRSRW